MYVATIACDKKNDKPRNYKEISESTCKKQCASHKKIIQHQ